ncbi:major histocompatibility complex class I-related gene protein-like [Tiliqua scincoides]|uniref:major histocompatibility complex class I-related gene protein-like n=1 Tax=Tiliqua scincoides TaxID=71010 RepID=UPI003462A62D
MKMANTLSSQKRLPCPPPHAELPPSPAEGCCSTGRSQRQQGRGRGQRDEVSQAPQPPRPRRASLLLPASPSFCPPPAASGRAEATDDPRRGARDLPATAGGAAGSFPIGRSLPRPAPARDPSGLVSAEAGWLAAGRARGSAEMGSGARWVACLLLGASLLRRGCSGSASHSLRYLYTGVSEPGPGLPRFVGVGYVDGEQLRHYDSDTRRAVPAVPWIEQAGREDPQYWERQTDVLRGNEAVFRLGVQTLMERYNQSGGLHTWQLTCGCELIEGAPRGGRVRYAYDGRDFIALDPKTLTWKAAVVPAQLTKAKWEADPVNLQYWKAYLEEECPEWLRKFLPYGAEALQRKEPPIVKVTRKDSQQGLETLLCRAHGFYPKEIDVTWRKDGKVRQEDAFHGVVSPNPDGTYYTGLSIEIDPKERSRYRCHVEHDGLQDPLDVAVKESVPVWLIAVGVILGVLGVLIVAGVIFYVIGEEYMEEIQAAEDVLVSRVP